MLINMSLWTIYYTCNKMAFTPTTVEKLTKEPNVWKNFSDLMKDQVKTVVTSLADVGTATIQIYTNSYTDNEFDSKSDYPVIVINEPELPSKRLANGITQYDGSIEIDVFACQKETASRFKALIDYTIETNKHKLADAGLQMIDFGTPLGDTFMNGGLKVHMMGSIINFKLTLPRTGGY